MAETQTGEAQMTQAQTGEVSMAETPPPALSPASRCERL